MNRVVITGIGMLTPCGSSTTETWETLLAAGSGIGPITQFDATNFPVRIAGEVKDFDSVSFMGKRKTREMGRFAQLSVVASAACLTDAGIELSDEDRELCGTFIGVGLGGIESIFANALKLEARGPKKISPYFIPQAIANLAAGQVAIANGLRGPSYCTTSACASSAHAIGDAYDWIRSGRIPLALAGGAEATINGLGISGFSAMYALSRRNDEPTRASRPWDRDRDGFVAGEGAATLMLESLEHAQARGARIYAEVTGYGASCDAHHITQPDPAGRGARAAMIMALKSAGVAADEVDYVNAHGTSTPQGDKQEAASIAAVFGEHALSKKLWVSSTKSAMGHLLGAAGGVETAICALALHHGKVPPTLNLDNPDDDLALDCVPHEARERPLRHALTNSFGFGGTNASLLLSQCDS